MTEGMQLQHSPDVTSVTADARPVKSVAADDTRAELERLNEELRRVRDRARKLLDVTTALSEARSVEDVTMVFLDKGLAVVEAARGVLVSVEGEKIRLLGELMPDGPNRRARRDVPCQFVRARDISEPREQAHGYAHAARSASARAWASSGSAVAEFPLGSFHSGHVEVNPQGDARLRPALGSAGPGT